MKIYSVPGDILLSQTCFGKITRNQKVIFIMVEFWLSLETLFENNGY